jgi:two-component system cell cycle response regulator DivK
MMDFPLRIELDGLRGGVMGILSGDCGAVLVVDDSDDVRLLICMKLRAAGYDVAEARDGREAVEVARATRPALILMDIRMPVMDGLAATRLLRDIRELSGMTIVAFSAFDSGGSKRRALEAGCNDFVDKVLGVNRVASIVRQYLGHA